MVTGNPPTTDPRRREGHVFAPALRHLRRLVSYPAALALAAETRVGTTPCDVVHERGSHRLLRYRRETPARWAEPVLFCYALINRPYILDLQPDKSVVQRYLAQGFEVYIIDWGVPGHEERSLTLEHYVCEFLDEAIRIILREHGGEKLHLLGYCMGGTLAAMATALQPDRVRSLTLLAAPLDFEKKESLLNVWADRAYFDVDAFVDLHGNCPAWFLQACFQNTKPVQNLVQKNLSMFESLDDRRFMSNYFAMELWVNDNIPVAGETFREFVKSFYQENALVRGEVRLGGHRVDLRRITCPMLLLMARNDHLVAPSSTEGIRSRVGSTDIESVVVDAGHVGLVVGSKAQRTLWPEATRWLAARSLPRSRPRPERGQPDQPERGTTP
jgi:polyhydroxyalkanoate synthase